MKLDIATYAELMARYNQWMNQSVYLAASQLSDQDRKADCGLFFKSIHGTLNHLLLCDRMWLDRFKGQIPSADLKALDQELYSEFTELKKARDELDLKILDWAASLEETVLPERLVYTSLAAAAEKNVDFTQAIIHFFNHQTHHRGQITTALNQAGVDVGVTDLLFMPEISV